MQWGTDAHQVFSPSHDTFPLFDINRYFCWSFLFFFLLPFFFHLARQTWSSSFSAAMRMTYPSNPISTSPFSPLPVIAHLKSWTSISDWALLVWHSWLQSPLSHSPITLCSSWMEPPALAHSHKSLTSHSDRVMQPTAFTTPPCTHTRTCMIFNLCSDFQTVWSAFFLITSLFSLFHSFYSVPLLPFYPPLSLSRSLFSSFSSTCLSASSHVPFGLQSK